MYIKKNGIQIIENEGRRGNIPISRKAFWDPSGSGHLGETSDFSEMVSGHFKPLGTGTYNS